MGAWHASTKGKKNRGPLRLTRILPCAKFAMIEIAQIRKGWRLKQMGRRPKQTGWRPGQTGWRPKHAGLRLKQKELAALNERAGGPNVCGAHQLRR